jgi:hypothetical protein
MIALSSCSIYGLSSSSGLNVATSLTNVQLSQNNFKVLGRVQGSANNWYLFGFGGLLSQSLYSEAKGEMISNANLAGYPRAIVDVTYDRHVRTILVWADHKITATGTLIEFTDENGMTSDAGFNADYGKDTSLSGLVRVRGKQIVNGSRNSSRSSTSPSRYDEDEDEDDSSSSSSSRSSTRSGSSSRDENSSSGSGTTRRSPSSTSKGTPQTRNR